MIDHEGNKEAKKVVLDTLFVNEIGQFGWYQAYALCLAAIIAIFGAFGNGEYIFTAAKINTRCFIPGCDIESPSFRPPWLENAVPATTSGFDECARFVNVTNIENSTCTAFEFDALQTEPCEYLVYENALTVAFDYDLGCNEWKRTLIGTIRMVGTFFALPITGFISDRWGRKLALTLNAFNMGWAGLLRVLSPSYGWFVFLETLEATLGTGAFSTCYILMTELTGPKYRVMAGASVSCFFALGQVILALIAWTLQDWRQLTIALYVPMLFTFVYYWLMPESVRWLMSKGRFGESEAILKKIARVNKKPLSETSLELLKNSAIEEEKLKMKQAEIRAAEPSVFKQVIRSPIILKRCLITPVWWVTNTLIYYGISINSVSLNGNKYLNYAYVNAIEIPGYWTTILVLDRIGRKTTIATGYVTSAVCLFIFIFSDGGILSLVMFLIAKYAISIVMTSTYIYTSELYPTKFRHTLFAYSSMIGRIGSMTAPLTPALAMYWTGLPSTLFATFALISAILLFFTPETVNKKLPDDMADAENL